MTERPKPTEVRFVPDLRPSGTIIPGALPKRERTSRFFSAAEWNGKPVPMREWLVHDWVPGRNVTLLSGDGGTGKSLLALQLTVAVAAQLAWVGKPVTQGPVIYISAEDDEDELHRRLDTILRAEGLTFADLERLTVRSLAGEDALLAIETTVTLTETELMREIEKKGEEAEPVLIVLDTLADLYPANENDRAKVRAFITMLRSLALRLDCAVLLLGHPSLTGMSSRTGTSGSTAWSNSVRARLYLERVVQDGVEEDPDKRVLSTKKSNHGRIGGQIVMHWQNGVFRAKETPMGLDAVAAAGKAERIFMKLLDLHTEQGRRVNSSGGTTYAPKVFAAHPSAEGMTKQAMRSAMEALLLSKQIVVMQEGPPSRRVSYLARAGQ